MNKEELITCVNLLKSHFTVNFMGSVVEGGCETCGYGGTEGMTLNDIGELLDNFVECVFKDKEMLKILNIE